VAEAVLPGDLIAGDVITLAEEDCELVVRAVRLGQGGFLLTVSDLKSSPPAAESVITVTAATPVFLHGKAAGI
jgi:hypothetical protein